MKCKVCNGTGFIEAKVRRYYSTESAAVRVICYACEGAFGYSRTVGPGRVMHWRIRLEDDYGQFWLTDRERMWSDKADEAMRFTSPEKALDAVVLAKARIAVFQNWFPRITIVTFK